MLLKLLKVVLYKSFPGVCDVEGLAFLNLIQHHKMVLIPMEDTGIFKVADGINRNSSTYSF